MHKLNNCILPSVPIKNVSENITLLLVIVYCCLHYFIVYMNLYLKVGLQL